MTDSQRVHVHLPNFTGEAGFARGHGGAQFQLAYRPNQGGPNPPVGYPIVIDGQRYTVAKAGRSEFVASLVLVDLVLA